MYHIQEFKIDRIYEEPTGKHNILPPFINAKLPATRNCSISDFESCLLDLPKKISTGTTKVNHLPVKLGSLTRDIDHFICKNPGQLPTGYGRQSTYCRFQGCTIYNDSDLGIICIDNKDSIGSNEAVMVN